MKLDVRKLDDDANGDRRFHSAIVRTVVACARHAWPVIVIASIVGAGACVYVVRHFAMDTDTAKLIAEDVPWRLREQAFDAAFPHRANLIAIVVDGATPDIAERSTAAIAQRLSSRTDVFRTVWRPDGGPDHDGGRRHAHDGCEHHTRAGDESELFPRHFWNERRDRWHAECERVGHGDDHHRRYDRQ